MQCSILAAGTSHEWLLMWVSASSWRHCLFCADSDAQKTQRCFRVSSVWSPPPQVSSSWLSDRVWLLIKRIEDLCLFLCLILFQNHVKTRQVLSSKWDTSFNNWSFHYRPSKSTSIIYFMKCKQILSIFIISCTDSQPFVSDSQVYYKVLILLRCFLLSRVLILGEQV